MTSTSWRGRSGPCGRPGGSRARRGATDRPTSSASSATSCVRVGDGAQALLEVADLGRLEQRQAADDRVRDALVAQPGDDGLAMAVLAVEHGEARPVRARPRPWCRGPSRPGRRCGRRPGAPRPRRRPRRRARPVSPVAARRSQELVGLIPHASLRTMSRLATASTGSTERKFSSRRRRVGAPGGGALGSCAGGPLKRRSNSTKAA